MVRWLLWAKIGERGHTRGMAVVREFAGSIRLLALALSAWACAHGIDAPLDLRDASNSGSAGATGTAGAGSAGGPGAGGSGGEGGASTGGAAGATTGGGGGAGGGVVDDGGGGTAGSAIVDAQGDLAGSGGAPDVRDAGVDVRADVAVEAGCGNATQCALKAALVHRYSFGGTGITVTDSVGTANGTVVNATLNGSGALALGGTNQYVDLPNGLVSQLTNATLEIWVTWSGIANWERIIDFGNSTNGMATTSLYVTPGGTTPNVLFVGFKRSDQASTAETRAMSAQRLVSGAMVHLAVVLDNTANQITLYRNGALDGSAPWNDSLSVLTDTNNWLGHSQWSGDPYFNGTLHEFRIYDAALSAAQVQASFMGGTDPPFLN